MQKISIQSFTDLYSWQEGHKLVLLVYKTTKQFPIDEKFSLTNQIQRAVISITSNIAEGFSRQGSKEKIQFYYMSLGSLTELQNQLLIAKDLGYISNETFQTITSQTITVSKLINGLIKSIKTYSKE
jgi:four helix bundle protein